MLAAHLYILAVVIHFETLCVCVCACVLCPLHSTDSGFPCVHGRWNLVLASFPVVCLCVHNLNGKTTSVDQTFASSIDFQDWLFFWPSSINLIWKKISLVAVIHFSKSFKFWWAKMRLKLGNILMINCPFYSIKIGVYWKSNKLASSD